MTTEHKLVEEKVEFPRNIMLRGSSPAPHGSFHRSRTATEVYVQVGEDLSETQRFKVKVKNILQPRCA